MRLLLVLLLLDDPLQKHFSEDIQRPLLPLPVFHVNLFFAPLVVAYQQPGGSETLLLVRIVVSYPKARAAFTHSVLELICFLPLAAQLSLLVN